MLKYLNILFMIMPLIGAAESFFKGPKQGAQKKAFVLQMLQGLLGIMGTVSTGGQLETWQRIAPHVGPIVDELAAIIFPSGAVQVGPGPGV